VARRKGLHALKRARRPHHEGVAILRADELETDRQTVGVEADWESCGWLLCEVEGESEGRRRRGANARRGRRLHRCREQIVFLMKPPHQDAEFMATLIGGHDLLQGIALEPFDPLPNDGVQQFEPRCADFNMDSDRALGVDRIDDRLRIPKAGIGLFDDGAEFGETRNRAIDDGADLGIHANVAKRAAVGDAEPFQALVEISRPIDAIAWKAGPVTHVGLRDDTQEKRRVEDRPRDRPNMK